MEASAFHQRGCRNKRVVSGPAGNQRFEACSMLGLIFLHLLPHEELGNLRNVTNLNSEMHAAGSSGEWLDAIALAPGILRLGRGCQGQQAILLKLRHEQGFLALET